MEIIRQCLKTNLAGQQMLNNIKLELLCVACLSLHLRAQPLISAMRITSCAIYPSIVWKYTKNNSDLTISRFAVDIYLEKKKNEKNSRTWNPILLKLIQSSTIHSLSVCNGPHKKPAIATNYHTYGCQTSVIDVISSWDLESCMRFERCNSYEDLTRIITHVNPTSYSLMQYSP